MKELSIEQKAERYDEALKWMENVYPTLSHEQQMEAEAFFPMFKESEDEEIRKSLIDFFSEPGRKEYILNGGFTINDILAWLEKQGEQRPIELSDNKKNLVDIVTERMLKEGPIPELKGKEKADFENEFNRFKQIIGMINWPAREEIYRKVILWFIAWSKDHLSIGTIENDSEMDKPVEWSKDEKIRKEIINFIYWAMNRGSITQEQRDKHKSWIAWLEKQGSKSNWCHHEVNLSNCSEEYRKAYYDGWYNCSIQHSQCKSDGNDVVKCLINGMKFYYEDNEEATWGTEKFSMKVKDILSWLEEQGEQKPEGKSALEAAKEEKIDNQNCVKPVDKAEPKFHEGEWVVSPNGVYWHIDKISNNRYEVTANTGESSDWNLDTNIYHRFTIQEIKNGDVLSYRDGQWIFIYKEKIDDNSFHYHALYSTIHQDLTIDDSAFTLLGDAIVPATNEERAHLFQKMKEAGYEWDANKRELKKIEQKPVEWSEEDDILLNDAIYTIKEGERFENKLKHENCHDSHTYQVIISWLKSLKERYNHNQSKSGMRNIEQKNAWSEEDERSIRDSIFYLKSAKKYFEKDNDILWDEKWFNLCIEWLESLYKRLQPTKQEWSKEDEDMLLSAIEYVCAFPAYRNSVVDWLKSLKNRVQPQPNPEWSEEDDYNLQCMIAKVTSDIQKGNVGRNNELIDWLKSLRYKTGSQKYWKPSDEHYELEEFAKIVRANLTGINKDVQKLFEAKYLQLTGNKMYGGFKD